MPHPFKILEHTSDIGITAEGATAEEAFANAATGLFSLIADRTSVDEERVFEIRLKGNNYEEQLFNYLDGLLYEFEVNGFLPRRVVVKRCTPRILEADAHGQNRDRHHRIKREIKGVTYHKLKVEELKDKTWKVQFVVDV